MSFVVKGKIVEVYAEAQVTDRFKKREFVIEIQEGMYPEFVKFQLTQDKCDLVVPYKPGDEVQVSFNLRGKPYTKNGTTTYFTNLDAWKIEGAQGSATAAASAPAASAKPAATSPPDVTGMSFSEAQSDDLPF
jgi:hypothetical protein